MTVAEIARALGAASQSGVWWRCICPVHRSRTRRSATLALRDGDHSIIAYCHAGCDRRDILAELRRRGLLCDGSGHFTRRGQDSDDKSRSRRRRIEFAARIWAAAQEAPESPVACYLADRGIITIPLAAVVPVVPEGRSPAADAVPRTTATTVHSAVVPGQGRQEDTQRQSFAGPGTSATAGTTKNEQLRAPQKNAFEERAAIIEYDAGVLRSWAESFARLNIADQPPGFRHEAWSQLIDDGGRFLDCWGMEAARLGWSALDVFGVHPAAPSTTFDAIGLCAAHQRRRRRRDRIRSSNNSNARRNIADLFAPTAAGRSRRVGARRHKHREPPRHRGG
jgi:hypothetical protein